MQESAQDVFECKVHQGRGAGKNEIAGVLMCI